MPARYLSQWAFVIFVAVGSSTALAQEKTAPAQENAKSAISLGEQSSETIQLKPGFQQEITLQGSARIGSIHVGDPKVIEVTTISDRQFVITGVPPEGHASDGQWATNVLVHDSDKKVIANFEVVVGYFQDTHLVEIHKRIGGKKTAGGGQTEVLVGLEKFQCSTVRCDLVSRDKSELPTQVQSIQQDIRQQNINSNPGPPSP
jgi:Flp pilus assembly secretin CpaC